MKNYYYNCPRGFSNEYNILSVDLKDPKEVNLLSDLMKEYQKSSDINWNFERITRKEAYKIIANARSTEKFYNKIGYNEIVGDTEITTISDFYYR